MAAKKDGPDGQEVANALAASAEATAAVQALEGRLAESEAREAAYAETQSSLITALSTTSEAVQKVDEELKRVSNIADRLEEKLVAAWKEAECYRAGRAIPLPAEIIARLKEPLPPEAVHPNPDKPQLSTIKTIFVIERLNDVFGIAGWSYTAEVVEADPASPMIVVRVDLDIPAYGIKRWAFGGNDMQDRGDAYKGAVTDALSKIGSMLYIGMAVYKGEGPTSRNGGRRVPERTTATVAAVQVPAGTVIPPCEDCKGEIKSMKVKDETYTPEALLANSRKSWRSKLQDPKGEHDGPALCGECQMKRRAAEREAKKKTNGVPSVVPPAPAAGSGPIR